MVEIQLIEKRSRGRPQIRCDDDTKSLIIEAADIQFRENGYAATSINVIAQTVGVSTKTLYRLFPAKEDLLSSIISDRINRFFLALDQSTLATMGIGAVLQNASLRPPSPTRSVPKKQWTEGFPGGVFRRALQSSRMPVFRRRIDRGIATAFEQHGTDYTRIFGFWNSWMP